MYFAGPGYQRRRAGNIEIILARLFADVQNNRYEAPETTRSCLVVTADSDNLISLQTLRQLSNYSLRECWKCDRDQERTRI